MSKEQSRTKSETSSLADGLAAQELEEYFSSQAVTFTGPE